MAGWYENKPGLVAYEEDAQIDRAPPYLTTRFAEAYISNGENATQAYYQAINADASYEVAMSAGCRWKNHTRVKPLIESLRMKSLEKLCITQERIAEELSKIAFLDMGELFDEDGNLLEIKDMPEAVRHSLASVEVFEEYAGRGEDREAIGRTKKFKLESKTKALELLGRWQKMFTDKVEHSVDDTLAQRIAEARKRVPGPKTVDVHAEVTPISLDNVEAFQ